MHQNEVFVQKFSTQNANWFDKGGAKRRAHNPHLGGKSFKTLSHRRKVAGHGLSLETIPTESSDC